MVRTTRKNCVKKMGLEDFQFDLSHELLIYKFLCGIGMKRKEWNALSEIDKRIVSYNSWKYQIMEKYKSENVEKLEAFSRYLNQQIRSSSVFFEGSKILLAGVVSAVFASVFTAILSIEEGVFILFSVPFLSFFVTGLSYLQIRDDCVKSSFYIDYKEIIDELLNSKK